MSKKNEQEIVTTNGRFYYKSKDGKSYLNIKSPLDGEESKKYIQITKEEYDELTYLPPYEPSVEELARIQKANRIGELKRNLANTDYVALKLAEGEITKDDPKYVEVFANRVAWRAEINELEGGLE